MKKIVVFLNTVLAWTLCLTSSTAQITPDASMPGENSTVQTYTFVGTISQGRSVDFINLENINLILTGVTGGKLSNLDGTLKVLGIIKECRPGQALGDGRFVYKRRGGIPPSPYELENAPAIWQDLRPHAVITAASLDSSNRSVTNKNLKQNIKLQQESIPQRPEIVEAQGWTRNATGQIVLTAKTAQLIAHGTEQPSAAC